MQSKDYSGKSIILEIFTNMRWDSSPPLESMMTVGRFVVSVLRSSLPAVISMSVIQAIKPTSRRMKMRNLHPWASYLGFMRLFWFLLPFG